MVPKFYLFYLQNTRYTLAPRFSPFLFRPPDCPEQLFLLASARESGTDSTRQRMTSNENSGYIKAPTFFTAIIIAFAIGLVCGVVLTAYKSGSAMPDSEAPSDASMEKMISALEAQLKERPEDVSLWVRLGHTCFDTGNHEKAIHAYEKALELGGDNADILTDLGVMYRRGNQFQKAVACFDRAISLVPSHETARFNKGVVLMHDLKDEAGALQVWKSLLELNPVFTAPNGQTLDELISHYEKHEK